MPTLAHAALRALRMKYNAANSAYREAVNARTESLMSGAILSEAQLEREAAALRTLDECRDALREAMAGVVGESPAD